MPPDERLPDRQPAHREPTGRRRARHRKSAGRPALAAAAVVAVLLACVAAGSIGVALRPLSGGTAAPGAALPQPGDTGGAPTATAAPSTARHPAATALTAEPTVPTSVTRSSAAAAGANTPAPTATTAVDASAALSRAEQQVLDLTNTARQRHGCRPLALDPRLARAAREHAHDMVARHYFSHVTPDGRDPSDRAMAAGFPAGAGENIAVGFPSASAVMDGWMGSKGHRANILDCGYTVIGVGYDPGTVLIGYAPGSWVQMFGTL